jgi:FolB domain-containing protein
MFKVVIEGLSFDAVIGILPSEKDIPQPLIVNAEIEYIGRYVDYAKVVELIEDIVKKGKYGLIEDALVDISNRLKEIYPQIISIKISMKKSKILKNALVGVEFLRKF